MNYQYDPSAAAQQARFDPNDLKQMAKMQNSVHGLEQLRPPPSGVSYQIQLMENNLASLQDAITMLGNKVAPIVRPVQETAVLNKESGGRLVPDSELASGLARFNAGIEEQVRRINALIQGVDL